MRCSSYRPTRWTTSSAWRSPHRRPSTPRPPRKGPLLHGRATVAFYISSHGYGHLTRSLELANALWHRRPDLTIAFRTNAPEWLIRAEARGPLTIASVGTDSGVAEIDALTPDIEETARQAASFYADFEGRAAREAAWLSTTGAALVVADIPPLAFAAAARAGIPSVAVANFTWDWIYEGFGDAFNRLAPGVVATIRRANAQATWTLRLPLHGGFDGMPHVRDIPFIARRSTRPRDDVRRRAGIASSRPVALVSFAGRAPAFPVDAIARDQRLTVMTFTRTLPPDLTYIDLIAAADVVIGKPGYGIVSDCLANGTAFVYTSRGRFVEYDVFVAQMPSLLRCLYIPRDDLLAGRWRAAVDAVLSEPSPPRPDTSGADVAADDLLSR